MSTEGSRKRWLFVIGAGSLGLALLLFVLFNLLSRSDDGRSPTRPDEVPMLVDNDPFSYDYPEDWIATLEKARQAADFPVLLPDHPDANPENVQEVFVRPGEKASNTSVFVMFPSPSEPEFFVRQAYIEVYIQRFKGEGDPRLYYQDAVDQLRDAGYTDEYSEIDGHPVITKQAHVPTDAQKANPAYLSTVVGEIELQITGGESVDRLAAIAQDLIAKYETETSQHDNG